MKRFQQLCAVVVLALTLASPAFAGEMGCPGVTSPPPDQHQTSATGDIQAPGALVAETDTPLTSDAGLVTEMALSLLAGALSVF
jgi:hypothetical protein